MRCATWPRCSMTSVASVEMVVAPRVAGELLSSKRRAAQPHRASHGKHVDVRVSEAVAARSRDLLRVRQLEPDVHPIELDELPPEAEGDAGGEPGEGGVRRRRRRRRRGRGRGGEGGGERGAGEQTQPGAPAAEAGDEAPGGDVGGERQSGEGLEPAGTGEPTEGGGRRRRRRRRRGRGSGGGEGPVGQSPDRAPVTQRTSPTMRPASPETGGDWGDDGGGAAGAPPESDLPPGSAEESGPVDGAEEAVGVAAGEEPGEARPAGGEPPQGEGDGRRRRRRRRRGRGAGGGEGGGGEGGGGDGGRGGRGGTPRDNARPEPRAPGPRKPEPASEPQRPRSLYGSSRRKLNPSELNKRPKPE
jgi:hypothetical protein